MIKRKEEEVAEISEAGSNIDIWAGQQSFLVMIIAKSGRGKSTAMEDLDPEKTCLINVMGKPLPFMKARRYVRDDNMYITSESTKIRKYMKEASKAGKEYIIIDDAQYIMATEFMDKAHVKGYDKWNSMARNIWEILILATKLRPGLKVFFLTHEEDTGDERKMKTLGKLLDDKITPEGLSTIVLFGDVGGTKENKKYYFSTQSDGYSNAKSPAGMFPPRIHNNLKLVADRIDEYYAEISLEKSKLNLKVD